MARNKHRRAGRTINYLGLDWRVVGRPGRRLILLGQGALSNTLLRVSQRTIEKENAAWEKREREVA